MTENTNLGRIVQELEYNKNFKSLKDRSLGA